MNYATVLLVSVALGIDAFTVAIGLGLLGVKSKEVFIVSGVVSLFHILMPLGGLHLGAYLGRFAGPLAGTIGALVLMAIGLNICWDSIRDSGMPSDGRAKVSFNIHNPVSIIVLAGSVSLDALSVGFGLGTLEVDLFLTVLTMGIVAGLMTAAGMVFGKGLQKVSGKKAGILGGLILLAIGLKLLLG